MSDFTHLHVHSHYSLLDGLGKIPDLVGRVKELGMDSLALTDHGVMYGSVEFVKVCNEAGIKPIVGVEAYMAPGGHENKRGKIDMQSRHLTLLAQNNEGYQNLIKLTTAAHLDGYYYKPRIDYDLLKEHNDGVVVLSGCMNSDISRAIIDKRMDDAKRLIEWHVEIFGPERFFLEVQHHPAIPEQGVLNDELFKLAKQYDLPVTATGDAHYIRPEDAEAQDVLVCIQTNKHVQDKDRLCMLGEDYSLKSPEFMKEAWAANPEVLESTQQIAEMCNVDITFGVNRLPHYPLAKGETADVALRNLCESNLSDKYSAKTELEEAQKRLEYELGVIEKTGFASYFLIVADFVNEAKRRDILVGPGRGSAAGSIVSYLTNITGIDPLSYNLLFERFLNPERVSMPDIDLDFADDRRDEVIEYVREKYGREHVAQIITFGTMAARAAVRDAGRALDFPYAFCDQVAKVIPMFTNFEEALVAGSELREMYDADPQVKRLVDTAMKLEGVCRHASTHAAGVVITEEPLTDHVPLQLSSTSKDEAPQIVTQYAMNEVEALGLLKMDFLGLKNLTIIQNTLKRIKKRYQKEIDIENLPLDKAEAYRLLQEGKSTGVFQLESAGMKRYLKELRPTEFEDIISMVALYRPGPMDSIPDFIASKHGRRKITYLHPLLKPILEKTYGVIVTQDQVLQIAREFAGLSYAEADILRKAVGKKIRKLLVEQREKFIEGAVERKKIDKKTADRVWDFIEPFARYGFNRAHAACYAMVAYQTAYLKALFPAEFMAALLTSDEGNTDRQAIEVAEAISMDIKVLPPDINESDQDFTVVDVDDSKAIRFGLGAVKNVGHNVVRSIIAERNENGRYEDLFDVFRRVDSKDFNRKSVESLVKAGAFDSLTERNHVLHNIEKLLVFNRTLHKTRDLGQQGLFGGEQVALPAPRVILEKVEEASKDDRLAWEKELLGLYLSEHPLSDLQKELSGLATPLANIGELSAGKEIRVAGIVTRVTKITTKSGQPMSFVTLEDLVGSIEVLVFPALQATTGELWQDGAKLLVSGKLSDRDDDPKVLADKVWVLSAAMLPQLKELLKPLAPELGVVGPASARSLTIQLPRAVGREQLDRLRAHLAEEHSSGAEALEVLVRVPRNGGFETIKTPYSLPREERAYNSLERIVGKSALRYNA